ncbi:MAG: hypothetical protein ACK4WD_07360 [Flavobacteriales bacterium]|jgi:hypothetical protein
MNRDSIVLYFVFSILFFSCTQKIEDPNFIASDTVLYKEDYIYALSSVNGDSGSYLTLSEVEIVNFKKRNNTIELSGKIDLKGASFEDFSIQFNMIDKTIISFSDFKENNHEIMNLNYEKSMIVADLGDDFVFCGRLIFDNDLNKSSARIDELIFCLRYKENEEK